MLTVIDATFATPYNVRPLAYGIDLVIHSITKYLAGHNDLMAGAVLGRTELTTPLRQMQGLLGNIVAPHTAYLILRGMKTLALARRAAECQRAGRRPFSGRPAQGAPRLVSGLGQIIPITPLRSPPCAALAGWSALRSRAMARVACRFIDALTIPTIGPSLGGVESMVSPLAVMGYANVSPEERAALGIRDELVRLCLGIEDTRDLIADLRQALEKIKEHPCPNCDRIWPPRNG